MSPFVSALVNLFRLLRNAYARVLRRPPDFIWIPVTGALPEFEPPRLGLLRRRLQPRPPDLSLEGIRGRLDRILADGRVKGVILRAEVLAVSPYKSAQDPISRSGFSKESREQVERLLDGRFGELVTAISVGRGITPEVTRALIDNAPYSASEAAEKNLLDGVLYE